jgi:hypothetical protein
MNKCQEKDNFKTTKINNMKKSEIIKKLNQIEGDFEVAIFDWKQNKEDGDLSFRGIYIDFDIELMDNDNEEAESQDKKFIAITIDNPDYIEEEIVTELAHIQIDAEGNVKDTGNL